MHVSPRVFAKQAAVAGLLFAFTGFASPAIHKHSTQTDAATACSCNSTSTASPKDIKAAQKEVDKAQKEFAKACKAEQHAAMKAQRKGDQAKASAKLEKYNAKLEKKQCELAQAQARLDLLRGNTAVAQNTQETESGIALSKPGPSVQPPEEPVPVPPSATEEDQSNIAETTPPPVPPPSTESTQTNESIASNSQQQDTETPRELPRTAGSLDLLGLIGLLSMGGSLSTFLRR